MQGAKRRSRCVVLDDPSAEGARARRPEGPTQSRLAEGEVLSQVRQMPFRKALFNSLYKAVLVTSGVNAVLEIALTRENQKLWMEKGIRRNKHYCGGHTERLSANGISHPTSPRVTTRGDGTQMRPAPYKGGGAGGARREAP